MNLARKRLHILNKSYNFQLLVVAITLILSLSCKSSPYGKDKHERTIVMRSEADARRMESLTAPQIDRLLEIARIEKSLIDACSEPDIVDKEMKKVGQLPKTLESMLEEKDEKMAKLKTFFAEVKVQFDATEQIIDKNKEDLDNLKKKLKEPLLLELEKKPKDFPEMVRIHNKKVKFQKNLKVLIGGIKKLSGSEEDMNTQIKINNEKCKRLIEQVALIQSQYGGSFYVKMTNITNLRMEITLTSQTILNTTQKDRLNNKLNDHKKTLENLNQAIQYLQDHVYHY